MTSSRESSPAATRPESHNGGGVLASLTSMLARRKKSKPAVLQLTWKPIAFSPFTLILATLMAWSLIALLQVLLVISERNGGVILASTINDIGIGKSFEYLYLPTIIALVFSIFWNWIDLQVKRLEPYHQLSQQNGAWGKDSLLISYPFDFLPFVPWSAFRSRHWAVFWASICVMLVTWGLVPLQAGIFATEIVTRTASVSFARSNTFMPASEQPLNITGRYIQSAHGIIWLNETLPPYMTREYMLAPFQSKASIMAAATNITWTSNTTLYSLDMTCETPKLSVKNETYISAITLKPTTEQKSVYTSSNGCGLATRYYATLGNETIGPNPSFQNQTVYNTKEFSAVYIGYYQTDFADYYLQGLCPETANHTFMAMYTRNKRAADDLPQPVTRLYCTPFYYQQPVSATIEAATQRPLSVTPTGEKTPLPADLWNATFFEYQMNEGRSNVHPQDSLPLKFWPDQTETVSTLNLSLGVESTVLSSMAGFSVGATNHTLEELVDPEALRSAYEATYRIIFARSMAEILHYDFSSATASTLNGTAQYKVAAVVVVPVFTYIVEGFLGLISLCSIALLVISLRRKWNLHSDPATVASVMALVADNPALLDDFAKLGRVKMDEFSEYVKNKKFVLENSERGNVIAEADNYDPLDNDTHGTLQTDLDEAQISKPVRPKEFRSFMVVPFVSLLIALAISLGVLLAKNQPYGIVRPSSTLMRQIVENYIPTALATLIEPVWILINRLLCLLQPLEELRGGKAAASRSIDADYSSLPPQLVMFKALRSSHFKLAVVCLMALLANVLAVAFSGVFEERSIIVPENLSFVPPYQHKFVSINGTVGPNMPAQQQLTVKPSGAYTGGLGSNQFLVAESNYTAGTPLPAWTDNRFMYMPFVDEDLLKPNKTEALQAQTTAIGGELECQLVEAQDWAASWFSELPGLSNLNISVAVGGTTCARTNVMVNLGPIDADRTTPKCQRGRVAVEYTGTLEARPSAPVTEHNFCAELAVLAYFRDTDICSRDTTTRIDKKNAVVFGCRSRLVGGQGDVIIDDSGRIQGVSQRNVTSDLPEKFLEKHFSNDASNLLRQGNTYLLPQFTTPAWHNQSYANDFMNYFMIKQGGHRRLTDPTLPPPSLDELTQNLYPVYSKLFAIWLGINKRKLLLPREEGSTFTMEGVANDRQIRIFLSQPLFIIAETILGIYVFAAICIYLWRPGRFLPRMPTSIAAVIALIAASQAVRDMRGTSLLSRSGRRKHLRSVGGSYGYGTFVGPDGKLHEGIEKEPLVNAVPLLGVVEKVQTGFSSKNFTFKRSHG